MKILDEHTKFAHLGKPGSAFTAGFQRRLNMIAKSVDLKDKKILDMGTGEGVWLGEFIKFTAPENVFASEYDSEQVQKILNPKSEIQNSKFKIPDSNIKICPGESLAFEDNTFDIVFHNEVLEHVQDDVLTLKECLRVLKPGGKMIFFTPNRGWPFEQHGMFFNGKYYWGNIPLLPWMPAFIYKKFAPHVKNYWWRDLRNKLRVVCSTFGINNKIVYHSRIFPGFNKMERRWGSIGKFLKNFIHSLEKTPLRFFGISHFVIVEKI